MMDEAKTYWCPYCKVAHILAWSDEQQVEQWRKCISKKAMRDMDEALAKIRQENNDG